MIDANRIRPYPDKIAAIQDVPTPSNVGDLRRFLGMVNHRSKFSSNLAEKTTPLQELLNKKNEWVWGRSQRQAFEDVKQALVVSPVLSLFDQNSDTIVSADASSHGLGAVLLQKQPGEEWKPVSYISRSLTPTE